MDTLFVFFRGAGNNVEHPKHTRPVVVDFDHGTHRPSATIHNSLSQPSHLIQAEGSLTVFVLI